MAVAHRGLLESPVTARDSNPLLTALLARPLTHSANLTCSKFGRYQQFIAYLDAALEGIRTAFPARVTYGRVGGTTSPREFHVWGANAANWNLPRGTLISGGGQAAAMGHQEVTRNVNVRYSYVTSPKLHTFDPISHMHRWAFLASLRHP